MFVYVLPNLCGETKLMFVYHGRPVCEVVCGECSHSKEDHQEENQGVSPWSWTIIQRDLPLLHEPHWALTSGRTHLSIHLSIKSNYHSLQVGPICPSISLQVGPICPSISLSLTSGRTHLSIHLTSGRTHLSIHLTIHRFIFPLLNSLSVHTHLFLHFSLCLSVYWRRTSFLLPCCSCPLSIY